MPECAYNDRISAYVRVVHLRRDCPSQTEAQWQCTADFIVSRDLISERNSFACVSCGYPVYYGEVQFL